VKPERVPEPERRERDALLSWHVAKAGGTKSGPTPRTPATKPFIAGILNGVDGRVLIVPYGASERLTVAPEPPSDGSPAIHWRSANVIDVFEPRGEYVGRISLPHNAAVRFARGDTLWAVLRDDDGINLLQKYLVAWR
jgi:hypothetical protein